MVRGGSRRVWSGIALILCLLAGAVFAFREHDGLNVVYKRWKADDVYVFEAVRPALVAQDAAVFLTLEIAQDLADRRSAVEALVHGGPRRPVTPYLDYSETTVTQGMTALAGLQDGRRFYLAHRPGVISYLYLMQPEAPVAGRGLIYHHGFAGSFLQHAPLLEAALAQGFTIVALDQYGYGENAREAPCEKDDTPDCEANLQYGLDKLNAPLALHIEPVRAAVDLLEKLGMTEIDGVGFSAGAGTIVLSAAVEPRLRRTVAAAGTLPYYLREGQDAPIGVAEYAPLRALAGMMDLYLLGSAGAGRAQLHLFNRYDRCCFRNVKGNLYAPVLQNRLSRLDLGGRFAVAIDETHARHKISDWGVDTILSFLTAP